MFSTSKRPRATVVYHPLKTDLQTLRSIVSRAEKQAGWARTKWVATRPDDGGTSMARAAVESGADMVLVAGGDGTIRAVAEGLRGSGVPIALIPLGTGNILSRNIGLTPGHVHEAVEAAFSGENRDIDVGVARILREDGTEDEHVFLVLAGMGLDARTIKATRSSLKKVVGWLAYVDAGLRTMMLEDPLRITYSHDGSAPEEIDVYSVMIGNCGLMPGGVLLIPDALIDDGELDVVAIRPLGPFSWLRIWNKIGWENGVLRRSKAGRRIIDLVNDTKSVSYVRAKNYALSVEVPELIQLDGDNFGRTVAVQGTVDPGAITIRVLPRWQTTAYSAVTSADHAGELPPVEVDAS